MRVSPQPAPKGIPAGGHLSIITSHLESEFDVAWKPGVPGPEFAAVRDWTGGPIPIEPSSYTPRSRPAPPLVRQSEIDRDLGLNLDWLAVKQIRTVFPLAHSINGCFPQYRIAAGYFHSGNRAFSADGRG